MDGYNFASIIAKIIFPLCAYVLLNILLDRKYMVVDAISEYVVCIPTLFSCICMPNIDCGVSYPII